MKKEFLRSLLCLTITNRSLTRSRKRTVFFPTHMKASSRFLQMCIRDRTKPGPWISSGITVEILPGYHGIQKPVSYTHLYTCHIRDPKVWKEGEEYRMILGGRQKSDQGAVLFYRSEDLKNWKFDSELTTEKAFGYMWECRCV